jgi:hypothetical protein
MMLGATPASRRLTGALLASIVLLGVCGGQAAPLQPPAADGLRVGAASNPLQVPARVPLAGYGSFRRRPWLPDLLGRHPAAFWFRPSVGTRDAVMARALVIETGNTRLLWATVDLVAVDDQFVPDLAARLRSRGAEFSAVIVSASHTHSGPGAFVDSTLLGLMVLDRYVPAVRAGILDGLADTVAHADRRRGPARIGAITVPAPQVAVSRLGLPLDPEIGILKFVRPDGAPVAVLWNYAIHPTMLGPRNLRLSGDVTGVASAVIEHAIGAPALFVNGAVGDVSPRRHGDQAIDGVGSRLAQAVLAALRGLDTRRAGTVALARERVDLPRPFLSARNCLGQWVPAQASIPLAGLFPRAVELLAIDLGDAVAVTVPGELQTALGLRIKAAGHGRGRTVVVAGLSNGYIGYLLDSTAYERIGYTACNSLYGPQGGEHLATAAARLMGQVRGAGYDSAASRRASADFLRDAVLR